MPRRPAPAVAPVQAPARVLVLAEVEALARAVDLQAASSPPGPITCTREFRTLSRLFLSETGLSFARWRGQVRILAAVQLLADGVTARAVARAVGYRKTSAFISAFRRATGQTPGTYIHANAQADDPGRDFATQRGL